MEAKIVSSVCRQQVTPDDITKMNPTYKTVISIYSLAAGEIGKTIGKPVVTEYPTGKAALVALNAAIAAGSASRYLIETPDGRQLPLDAAYTEVFGVAPIYSEGPTRYPHLKK